MHSITNKGAAARRLPAVCAVAALVLGIAGCNAGPKSTVPLVPASGKVTLDGAPLGEAVLEFIPVGETHGQGGNARTNPDGGYTAATPFGEPGLAAGAYMVVISKRALPQGATPPEKNLPPAYSPYQEVLSPAYSDRVATTLNATVPATGEATNNFPLNSGPPPS